VKKLVFTLFALALVCGAQLHLPALQMVAWTGMVVKYAQDVSLTEALEMTFDGDHPCPLCKAIRKAQTGRQQEIKAPSLPEHSPWVLESAEGWANILHAWSDSASDYTPRTSVLYRPPVPPPRTTA
jgi:hypothetical protein